MLNLTMDEVKNFAGKYQAVPVMKEILLDMLTPISILNILKQSSNNYFLLESVEGGEKWARYSFIGCDPVLRIVAKNNKMEVKNSATVEFASQNPLECLRSILKEYKTPELKNLPPFTGGFVGYFGYEFFKYCEPDFQFSKDKQKYFPDIDLMLFDKVIALDHLKQKIKIIVNVKLDNPEINYRKAELEIENILRMLRQNLPYVPANTHLSSMPVSNLSKAEYVKMVERGKEYIKAGDIFQVVLSQQLSCSYEGDLFNIYRYLRTINPSQYMVFLKNDDIEIAGSSPETLVKVENREITTMPIAGTRPRGTTEDEDLRLEEELLSDEKEIAEHNMLVDLGRNDVGRVSAFNSVQVKDYKKINRFSHVMHIASRVTGTLAKDKDALDALCSIFPAGTLSGAPKIRACEIIDELESASRGVYGGGMGYIGFGGNLDVCITIRTLVLKNARLYIQAGAGIVADSIAENEYQECLNKAGALINALKQASENRME